MCVIFFRVLRSVYRLVLLEWLEGHCRHRAAQGTVTGVRIYMTSFGRRGQMGGWEDRLCDATLLSRSLSVRDPYICVTFMILNGSRVLVHCICLSFCSFLCGHFLVLHPASHFSAGKNHWQVLHYL